MFAQLEFLTGTPAAATGAETAVNAAQTHRPTLEEGLEQLRNFSFNDFIADLSQRLVHFAIDVAIAILVFYVGKFIIRRIYRLTAAVLVRRKVDGSLCTFILSFVNIVMYFILIVTVIGILGIETSSFLALFASAGVAIGMALSGTLQNFAGGVLILLLKPYKVGDYIEAQGYAGYVREVQIFHTLITTYDNKAISIPNGGLSTSSVNNWSREEYRRITWNVSISYGDSVADARNAILALFAADKRIINDPAEVYGTEPDPATDERDFHATQGASALPPKRPGLLRRIFGNRNKVKEALERWEENRDAQILSLKPHVVKAPVVSVEELGESSVNIKARAWVRTADYWTVFYDLNELIYTTLPQKGLHFPFPQMDVHLKPQA